MRQIVVVAVLCFTVLQPVRTFAQTRGAAPQPQRGQPAAKAPTPMTIRQVIESLFSLRNSKRVEDLISKNGVQFEANPTVVDILKQFGASPKLISMIPVPAPPPPPPPPPKLAGPLTVVCEPIDCTVVVDEKFVGPTDHNRTSISGLKVGETT